MIVLYILAAVVGVIALLLLCRIYIYLSYCDGDIVLSVRYAFLRVRLMPSKEGKIRLGDYTYEKIKKKESAKKAKKKQDRKTESKKSATVKKHQAAGTGVDEPKKSVVATLFELREIIFDVLKRAPGKLRLEIKRLLLSVGAGDAASTAVTYGALTQAAGAALTLAEEHADVRIKRGAVMIIPDFLSGKIDADVSVRLSVRVGSIAGLGIRFVINFLKLRMQKTDK